MFISEFVTKEVAEFTNNTSKRLKHSGNALSCQGIALFFFLFIIQCHSGHCYTWAYDKLAQYFIKMEFSKK